MAFVRRPSLVAAALAVAALSVSLRAQEGFKFKSGVELVNVTATVTGVDGRFVPGLRKEDFRIFDDDRQQQIEYFSADRVAVSLGILLDASGSMADDKMTSARRAINRFVTELLDDNDELFFIQFNDHVILSQDWTSDRQEITRAVARVNPVGGTAMYDAIAQALPIAATGRHTKKALLVISDGNDTDSRISATELRAAIRESEVLVYALGIDGLARNGGSTRTQPQPQPRRPPTGGFPIPGIGGRGRFPFELLPQWRIGGSNNQGVNASALRAITDDTGGRTEIIHQLSDLSDATARIADELSKQYSLGYTSPGLRDGKWHNIRVEVANREATVRARRGYFSS